MRSKLWVILVLGLFVRLIVALYTTHTATWETMSPIDLVYIYRFNPLVTTTSLGTSFYLFYMPIYIPYLILNHFGIYYNFLLVFLFKLPPLVGDIIAFYALYNIALQISKDGKKSLAVATTYFLNPYIIWMSAIVGHSEQLMIAFVLLSVLYLLRDKIYRSGLFLAIAVFYEYLPFLLLPCILAYLYRKKRSIEQVKFFVVGFLPLSAILSIPYLKILVDLSSSPAALGSFMDHVLGVFGTGGRVSPLSFKYNFTGFLASLGIWPELSGIFSSRVFILLFVVASIILLKRTSSQSIHLVNRSAIVMFSLFMVILPLTQHHYLLWVFPFLLIESTLLRGLPRYYLHVLWISNMLIDPLIGGNFLWYFDTTFPGVFPTPPETYWPLVSLQSQLSISVLHGLFLVLTVILCLSSISKDHENKKMPFTTKIQISFSMRARAFSINLSKLMMAVNVGTLTALLLIFALSKPFHFELSFLMIQLLFIVMLLLVGINLKYALFLVIPTWIAYGTLAGSGILALFLTLLYFISWLYLVITKRIYKGETRAFLDMSLLFIVYDELKKKASKNKLTFYGLMILMALLLFTPLIYVTFSGGIPNSRGYVKLHYDFYGGNYTASHGYVKSTNEGILIGSLDQDRSSSATWKVNAFTLPYMSEQMKKATSAYIRIRGNFPMSNLQPTIEPFNIGWQDDNFTSGWGIHASQESKNFSEVNSNGFYIFNGTLANDRDFILTQKEIPNISTNDYAYFISRWKSSAKIARISVGFSDGTGVQPIASGILDNNGYSGDWKTTVFAMPPNKTVNVVILGLDDTFGWLQSDSDVTGFQSVYFDFVMFSSISNKGAYTQIFLNDNLVFDEILMDEKQGLFTLLSGIYETWSNPETLETYIAIPFDFDFLRTENLVNITVSDHVTWSVDTVIIYLYIDVANVDQPV